MVTETDEKYLTRRGDEVVRAYGPVANVRGEPIYLL
jgi:hypothetical protein